jgi:DNA primase
MDLDLELVDTKSLLDDLDIEYKTSGKNIGSGCVGIVCPFCGDQSNHCGIFIKRNLFKCWVCQEKGSIIRLIKEIKGISYTKAENIVKGYLQESSLALFKDSTPASANSVRSNRAVLAYPVPLLETIPEPHRQYLLSRNFDPDLLTKKYRLRFTYNTGEHRFRIIAPIIVNGKAVSWIAADVIRKGDTPPYIKCPREMSILSANDCLYNIDSVGSVAILVEGITDVWRIGDGCVASMTKAINPQQVRQLSEHGVKKVVVMYDSDAFDMAQKTARKLQGNFSVDVAQLTEGDPADLSINDVIDLRAEVFK